VHVGEIMTGEVRWLLEVEPAGHGTEVEMGIMAGGQEMGGMEAKSMVKLDVNRA